MARRVDIRFLAGLTMFALALAHPAAHGIAQETPTATDPASPGTPGAPVVRFLVQPQPPEATPVETHQPQTPEDAPAAAPEPPDSTPPNGPSTGPAPVPDEEAPRLRMMSATSQFIEHYYKTPEPAQALALLETLDVPAFVTADNEVGESHGIAVLTAFFAHVLRANPELVPELAERITTAEDPVNVVLAALSIATAAAPTSPDGLSTIAGSGRLPPAVIDQIRATEPFPFPHLDPRNHLDLDLLWASFYASGDPRYVERIAETLRYLDTDYATRLPRDVEGTARLVQQVVLLESVMAITARWTLLENARRHPRVLETLQRIDAERDDRIGTIVASILAEAEGG